MAEKSFKFSAFKLFYDEFVYKENVNVSYLKVKRHIDIIRKYTLYIRRFSKCDLKLYTVKLDRINKRFKNIFNEILKIEPEFLNYYLTLYKDRVKEANDSLKEVPFILTCSFYEDYRYDNKNYNLEDEKILVPRFSSLEKRKYKEKAKRVEKIDFFINLLNDSNYSSQYRLFIRKINYIKVQRPNYDESNFNYFKRLDCHFKSIERLAKILENKCKKNGDYELVRNIMMLVYKNDFSDWVLEINKIIKEYIDKQYNTLKDNSNVLTTINLVNNISFDSYQTYVNDLINEKDKFERQFYNDSFSPIKSFDNSNIGKFKELLVNNYFDERYILKLNNNSEPIDYANFEISLFILSFDLENQLFEKTLYDASHAKSLKRNNDVDSAIINKLYELYNPYTLLKRYNKVKDNFEKLLDSKNDDFKYRVSSLFTSKKQELDLHGPLPSSRNIKVKVNEKKKDFILENVRNELVSFDKNEDYDTRNYDLSYLTDDLNINEMVKLYEMIKYNINNSNEKIKINVYTDQELLVFAQKFVCKDIYNKLNGNASLKDICITYLHEQCLFINTNNNEEFGINNLSDFISKKNDFNLNSKWNKFLKKHKIKNV